MEGDDLFEYQESLPFGEIFAKNQYGKSVVVCAETSKDGDALVVLSNMTGNPIKEWSVSKVTIEGDKFVHESIGTYFGLAGATKFFCIERGEPWHESIDDFS